MAAGEHYADSRGVVATEQKSRKARRAAEATVAGKRHDSSPLATTVKIVTGTAIGAGAVALGLEAGHHFNPNIPDVQGGVQAMLLTAFGDGPLGSNSNHAPLPPSSTPTSPATATATTTPEQTKQIEQQITSNADIFIKAYNNGAFRKDLSTSDPSNENRKSSLGDLIVPNSLGNLPLRDVLTAGANNAKQVNGEWTITITYVTAENGKAVEKTANMVVPDPQYLGGENKDAFYSTGPTYNGYQGVRGPVMLADIEFFTGKKLDPTSPDYMKQVAQAYIDIINFESTAKAAQAKSNPAQPIGDMLALVPGTNNVYYLGIGTPAYKQIPNS